MNGNSQVDDENKIHTMKMITLYIPDRYLGELEELVRDGYFPNRSEAIRMAIRDLIRNERMKSKSMVGEPIQEY
jgi:antitoxin ParD1/3/4